VRIQLLKPNNVLPTHFLYSELLIMPYYSFIFIFLSRLFILHGCDMVDNVCLVSHMYLHSTCRSTNDPFHSFL
jgi:hypothetical protein